MLDGVETIRTGLALVMAGLIFGIGLGITFGVNEDVFKDYVAEGVAAYPQVHDEKSESKIWRYVQRAHFHATGIAAFSIGLLLLAAGSSLSAGLKKIVAVLIGLGSLYPLAWFNMFLMAPRIGRDAAHEHILTEVLTYIGVGALVTGLLLLLLNVLFGLFSESR